VVHDGGDLREREEECGGESQGRGGGGDRGEGM